jgi:4-hydroxybenzoate polyprenyltransferase
MKPPIAGNARPTCLGAIRRELAKIRALRRPGYWGFHKQVKLPSGYWIDRHWLREELPDFDQPEHPLVEVLRQQRDRKPAGNIPWKLLVSYAVTLTVVILMILNGIRGWGYVLLAMAIFKLINWFFFVRKDQRKTRPESPADLLAPRDPDDLGPLLLLPVTPREIVVTTLMLGLPTSRLNSLRHVAAGLLVFGAILGILWDNAAEYLPGWIVFLGAYMLLWNASTASAPTIMSLEASSSWRTDRLARRVGVDRATTLAMGLELAGWVRAITTLLHRWPEWLLAAAATALVLTIPHTPLQEIAIGVVCAVWSISPGANARREAVGRRDFRAEFRGIMLGFTAKRAELLARLSDGEQLRPWWKA